MLIQFKKHLSENLPFLQKSKLLIAISGGIDSVVLLHLLNQLKYDVALAHCNFKLRAEESDKDEVFIRKLARDLSLPSFIVNFDTKAYAAQKKISIQILLY